MTYDVAPVAFVASVAASVVTCSVVGAAVVSGAVVWGAVVSGAVVSGAVVAGAVVVGAVVSPSYLTVYSMLSLVSLMPFFSKLLTSLFPNESVIVSPFLM